MKELKKRAISKVEITFLDGTVKELDKGVVISVGKDTTEEIIPVEIIGVNCIPEESNYYILALANDIEDNLPTKKEVEFMEKAAKLIESENPPTDEEIRALFTKEVEDPSPLDEIKKEDLIDLEKQNNYKQ